MPIISPTAISPHNRRGIDWSSYWTPQYQAWYDAMPTKPSDDDKLIQMKMVKSYVDRGYFAKAEFMDIFCTHAGGSAVNLRSPGTHDPIPINNPIFEEYVGYTGDSVNARYVRLNFIPSEDAVSVTKTNMCLIYGVANNVQENRWDVGVYDGSTSLSVLSRDTADAITMLANADGTGLAIANTNSVGHYAFSRNNDSSHDDFKNVFAAQRPGNNAAENLVTKELYACGRNQNGTPAPCNRTICYVMMFSYLKPWEVEEVIAIMEKYLRSYGKGLLSDKYFVPQIDTLTNLHLDTYVENDGSTVHPSVIKKAISGYNFWMANTPYTDNNNKVENPSIWASLDARTWIVPSGLTNPLVPAPALGFNCDNDIFYDDKFYLIWNEAGVLSIITSIDGKAWGGKQAVTVEGAWSGVSPSIIKIEEYYYIYYIEYTKPVGVLKRQRADNVAGPYSTPEVIALPESGYWHFDIVKIGDTYWLPMANSSISGMKIYKSDNCVDFVEAIRPLIRYSALEITAPLYRPTIIEMDDNQAILYVPINNGTEYFTHSINLILVN